MKHVGLLFILLALFLFSGFSTAKSTPVIDNSLPENYEYQQPVSNMPPVTIDGVDVPHEVLTYAQMAYQGYAVTQAKKIMINGVVTYELRIDNDSYPNDSNGLVLLYDAGWKLLGEKAYYAAPRPKPIKVDTIEPEPIEVMEEPESAPEIIETTEEPAPEDTTEEPVPDEDPSPRPRDRRRDI